MMRTTAWERIRIPAITLLIIATGCATSQQTFDPPRTLTGQILVVGNEPFTSLAVIVDGKKTYLIHCNDRIKELLMSNQGRTAELVYNRIHQTRNGDEIEVLSAVIKSS